MLDLTKSEKQTLVIIFIVLFSASSIHLFNATNINPSNLDYSESDSIFSRLSHVKPQTAQKIPNNQINDIQSSGRPSLSSQPIKTENKTLININTATENELRQLPRIGPAMAKRILNHRNINGPFRSNSDLLNIKGIGPKTFEKIKPYLRRID